MVACRSDLVEVSLEGNLLNRFKILKNKYLNKTFMMIFRTTSKMNKTINN